VAPPVVTCSTGSDHASRTVQVEASRQAIAARSTPAEHMRATAFYAGFAGPASDYGRRLARLESWGAGGADDGWRAASPWRQLNLPQIRPSRRAR